MRTRGRRARRASRDCAPGDLNRVFFTTGGGEAVETAWKLAKQYFKLTGKPTKHKVISRAVAYHGTPQGALSITGIPAAEGDVRAAGARRVQGAQHQPLPRAGAPAATTPKAFGAGPPTASPRRSSSRAPTPSRRCSSSRCRTPAAASRRRPATSSGCARSATSTTCCSSPTRSSARSAGSATMFACDDFGYVPDIITCAKGMTAGYSPIGAMIASDRLFEPFQHGHDVVPPRVHVRRAPGVVRRWRWPTSTSSSGRASTTTSARTRRRSGRTLEKLLDLPIVGDVRGDGLLLRHRAGQGQGDQGDLRRRRVRAPAARLPLQGAVRRRPVLPRRRPRRPGDPARAAAHHRPPEFDDIEQPAALGPPGRPRPHLTRAGGSAYSPDVPEPGTDVPRHVGRPPRGSARP